jgi:predicted lipoprotein with Yx(FWY)xxD motif
VLRRSDNRDGGAGVQAGCWPREREGMIPDWNRAVRGAARLPALTGLVLLVAACGSGSRSGASSSAATGSSRPPSTVAIGTAQGQHGTYLTGAAGRALYLWVGDSDRASNCSGACAASWPPVLAEARPVPASRVKVAALSTVIRSDGREQVSYDGHPLYYYIADPGPGTTRGEGRDDFGAKWWLVAPSGAAITTKGGSATAPPVGY